MLLYSLISSLYGLYAMKDSALVTYMWFDLSTKGNLGSGRAKEREYNITGFDVKFCLSPFKVFCVLKHTHTDGIIT